MHPAAVENQILGQFFLDSWDVRIGGNLGRINNSHIQAGLDAVVTASPNSARAGL